MAIGMVVMPQVQTNTLPLRYSMWLWSHQVCCFDSFLSAAAELLVNWFCVFNFCLLGGTVFCLA